LRPPPYDSKVFLIKNRSRQERVGNKNDDGGEWIHSLVFGEEKRMSRKESILELLGSHADALHRMGVAAIGLFGSVVRGEDTPASDIDILVEFEEQQSTFCNFNALCDFLERTIGDHYDLVTRKSLSPYMKPHILDEVEYALFS
jgi:uncharacterized protein